MGGIVYVFVEIDVFLNVVINELFDVGYGLGGFKWCLFCKSENDLYFLDIVILMKFWLLLCVMIFFFMVFLIVLELKKVLLFICDIVIFYCVNYCFFSVIGNYGFLISLFSVFNFYVEGGEFFFNFSIFFLELGFLLGSWVLVDIFWEGKLLLEDN